MKKLLFLPLIISFGLLFLLPCESFSQSSPFRFRYLLNTSLNSLGQFIEKDQPTTGGAVKVLTPTGEIIIAPGSTSPAYNINTMEFPETYTSRTLLSQLLAGKIEINETRDKLYIMPWYEPNYSATKRFGSPITDDKTYYFEPTWNGYSRITIPFRYSGFFVTSLPFKVNLHTGEFENEFLNANIAYLFVFGNTKFYHSKFLEPRHAYTGFGPYIGASTIKEKETDDSGEESEKDVFGFNYGFNIIRAVRNIDLTLALGAETSFKSKTNDFNPYIGIGLGIKLIEFYEPETKH